MNEKHRKDPFVMSIGFAGSKHLDERRRRRLAQEGAEVAPACRPSGGRRRSSASEDSALPAQPSSADEDSESTPAARSRLSRLPIWRETWKHGLLILLLTLAAGGVCWVGWWLDHHPVSGLHTLLGLKSGRLWGSLQVVYSFAAMFLAWVVFYGRSCSRLDFGGQYRLWISMALLWTGVTFCIATGWHLPLGEQLADRMNFRHWNGPVWCRVVPLAAALLSMSRLLTAEFQACRAAWILHVASVISAGVAGSLLLLAGTPFERDWHYWIIPLAALLWPTWQVSSLLLFLRHVIHISNEPSLVKRRAASQPLGATLRRWIIWLLTPPEELEAYGESATAKTASVKRSARGTRSRGEARSEKSAGAKSRRGQPVTKPGRGSQTHAVDVPETAEQLKESADVDDDAPMSQPAERTAASLAAVRTNSTVRGTASSRDPILTAKQTRIDPPQKAPAPKSLQRLASRGTLEIHADEESQSHRELATVSTVGHEEGRAIHPEPMEPQRHERPPKRMKGKKRR